MINRLSTNRFNGFLLIHLEITLIMMLLTANIAHSQGLCKKIIFYIIFQILLRGREGFSSS